MYKLLKNLIEMDDYSVQRLSKSSSIIEYIWYKLWGKTIQTLLPSEYQQVDYIVCTGTQYINTGLIGTDLSDSEIELTIKNNTTGLNDYNFNGSYQTGKTTQMGTVATSDTTCRSIINFGFTDAVGVGNLDITKFHKLYAKNGLQKINDTQVGTTSFGSLNEYPFLLFARTNVTGTTTSIDFNRGSSISSFWVKKNDNYIRNLVPCYRKSDNEVGMYDLSATSKNLFDGNYVNAYLTATGKYQYPDNTTKSIIVKCEPNTTYTIKQISYNSTRHKWRIAVFNSMPTHNAQGTLLVNDDSLSESTITTLNDSAYIVVYYMYPTPLVDAEFMINLGTTALPYEPYQKRFYTNDGTGSFTYGSVLPTPSNPVEVKGVGDRTGNLFDKTAEYVVGNTTYNYTISGLDPNKYYTCSTNFERISGVNTASLYFGGGSSVNNGVWSDTPRTFKPNSSGEIVVYIRYTEASGALPIIDDVIAGTIWVMVNEDSTALPYEPYGYKIPIVCDNEIKNIYLNEPLHKINDYADILSYSEQGVVRKIKKLVLTGEEGWTRAANSTFYGSFVTDYFKPNQDSVLITMCSHYVGDVNRSSTATVVDKTCSFRFGADANTIYIRDTDYNSVTVFKTYLQQQYAAGTPVTVWYVLATEETEQIKAPDILADTYTSITVDTEVQPSQVDFTTKGKKVEPTS